MMKPYSTDDKELINNIQACADSKQEGAIRTPENRVSYSDSSEVPYNFVEHIRNRFLVVN